MAALKQARSSQRQVYFLNFLQRYVVLPKLYEWKLNKLKWSGHVVGRYHHCTLIKGSLRTYMRTYSDLAVLQTLVTKNVIITRRMSDCHDSFYYHPDYHGSAWEAKCDGNYGVYATKTAHVIHIGAKKGEAEEVMAKYTALGYRVIDLTKQKKILNIIWS